MVFSDKLIGVDSFVVFFGKSMGVGIIVVLSVELLGLIALWCSLLN